MIQQPEFEVGGEYAIFRPSGRATNEDATQAITAAVQSAKAANLRRLLVVVAGWSGLTMPGIGQRYYNVREWAEAAGGRVALALVLRQEMIRHDEFGIIVAANAGFLFGVFASEEEAASWLRTAR